MVHNNANLPSHLYGYLRTEFCNNLDPDTKGIIECIIFGIEVVPDRAPMFHVLREDGALYSQLPLHALAHKPDAPPRELSDLQRWDAFGWNVSVVRFDYLHERRFDLRLPSGTESGVYVCTVDYLDNGFSEEPTQHKHFHLIALDDGNFALQSNDFCRVYDNSFTIETTDHPRLQRNRLIWRSEK